MKLKPMAINGKIQSLNLETQKLTLESTDVDCIWCSSILAINVNIHAYWKKPCFENQLGDGTHKQTNKHNQQQ